MFNQNIHHRIQKAISAAVDRHRSLGKKTFYQDQGEHWKVRPEALYVDYSSTEAMIAGILIELFFESYGSSYVTVRPGTLPDDLKPSQLVWKWAPAFYLSVNWLDYEQAEVLRILLNKPQYS